MTFQIISLKEIWRNKSLGKLTEKALGNSLMPQNRHTDSQILTFWAERTFKGGCIRGRYVLEVEVCVLVCVCVHSE